MTETFDRLVGLIEKLMSSPTLQGRRIRGIGIGVPGVTLHQDGIVKWAYAYTWRDFPLKQKIERAFLTCPSSWIMMSTCPPSASYGSAPGRAARI